MIISDLLNVNLHGGVPGELPGPGGQPLQLLEIKGIKFEDALVSRFQQLTGTSLELPEQPLAEPGLVQMDGKVLPELPPGLLPPGSEEAPLLGQDPELMETEQAELPGTGMLVPDVPVRERLPVVEQGGRPVVAQTTEAINVNSESEWLVDDSPVQANDLKQSVLSGTLLQSIEQAKSPAGASEKTVDNAAMINTVPAAKPAVTESNRQVAVMPKLDIQTPVQQQGWSDSFSGRISWMIMNNQPSAQINLNPAELGPIEVKIHMHNDQASVSFTAHNSTARDAIQDAFPRLREMLVEHGLSLGQSSVSDQSFSGQTARGQAENPAGEGYAIGGDAGSPDEVPVPVHVSATGLIDHFV